MAAISVLRVILADRHLGRIVEQSLFDRRQSCQPDQAVRGQPEVPLNPAFYASLCHRNPPIFRRSEWQPGQVILLDALIEFY